AARARGWPRRARGAGAGPAAGGAPRWTMEMGGRGARRGAIAQGRGIGAISRGELGPAPRRRALALPGARLEIEEHVVCAAARADARLVRDFVAIARIASCRP